MRRLMRAPVVAGRHVPVRAVHAVLVVPVAAGARVARVTAAPALAARAVRVRLRHVVPCNARVSLVSFVFPTRHSTCRPELLAERVNRLHASRERKTAAELGEILRRTTSQTAHFFWHGKFVYACHKKSSPNVCCGNWLYTRRRQ